MERDRQVHMLESACQTDTQTEIETRTAALGLLEGLSHSTLLRSIVIVLKSQSTLLCSIVIVLKVVAAKTNRRENNYGIRV